MIAFLLENNKNETPLAPIPQVEEQHTQEAVGADKREAGLRQRVAELEEGLRSVSTAGAVRRHVAVTGLRVMT